MRKFLALAAVSLLVAACGERDAAQSDPDAPGKQAEASGGSGGVLEPRAGLWENVVDDGSSVDTIRQCIDQKPGAVSAELDEPARAGCTKTRRSVPGGVAIKSICPNETPSEMEVVLTGDSTKSQLVTTMTVSGQKITMRSTGRWVGPCPEGMRDGDLVQDGV